MQAILNMLPAPAALGELPALPQNGTTAAMPRCSAAYYLLTYCPLQYTLLALARSMDFDTAWVDDVAPVHGTPPLVLCFVIWFVIVGFMEFTLATPLLATPFLSL